MKLKKELVLRKVGDEYILVPIGKTVDEFNGLFDLTESGAFIFERLSSGLEREEIVGELLNNYEIDEAAAYNDYDTFILALKDFGIV